MDAEATIRALVVAYAEHLDAGDFDAVAALFEHAQVRSARDGAVREGRAAVRRMYDPVIVYDDGTPRTKHVLGNVVVTVDERAGTASGRCTFTVMQAAPGTPLRAVLSGRYLDRFARDERSTGGWRFSERTVYPDLLGDLSQHMAR
jgi:3-phenylpropionate/cinnamic acid dioxygenase small subunit